MACRLSFEIKKNLDNTQPKCVVGFSAAGEKRKQQQPAAADSAGEINMFILVNQQKPKKECFRIRVCILIVEVALDCCPFFRPMFRYFSATPPPYRVFFYGMIDIASDP